MLYILFIFGIIIMTLIPSFYQHNCLAGHSSIFDWHFWLLVLTIVIYDVCTVAGVASTNILQWDTSVSSATNRVHLLTVYHWSHLKICSNLGLERIFLSLSQFIQFCLTRDSNCVSVDSKKLKLKSDSPLSQRKTLHVKICISCSLSGPVEVRSQVQVLCVAGGACRRWMFSDLHE